MERERERGYSNFRSRDKRSVLTRCSSNKQAESFSISSEKRGKSIEEVEVDPRAACTHALFSRLLYWESLAARITRGILPENTILHSKDRRTDALPLWIADSYGIRMNGRGRWAPSDDICVYPRALLGVEPRKSAQRSRKGSMAEQFSAFPFFPRIRLNGRSAIPSTNLVQRISKKFRSTQ